MAVCGSRARRSAQSVAPLRSSASTTSCGSHTATSTEGRGEQRSTPREARTARAPNATWPCCVVARLRPLPPDARRATVVRCPVGRIQRPVQGQPLVVRQLAHDERTEDEQGSSPTDPRRLPRHRRARTGSGGDRVRRIVRGGVRQVGRPPLEGPVWLLVHHESLGQRDECLGSRRLLPESGVRPRCVVLPAPGFDDGLRFGEVEEGLSVQQLVA